MNETLSDIIAPIRSVTRVDRVYCVWTFKKQALKCCSSTMKPKKSLIVAVVSIAVIALGLLARNNFLNAQEAAKRNGCIANLHQIEGLKAFWKDEMKKSPADVPTENELMDLLKNKVMLTEWYKCPLGGSYTIGRLDQRSACSIPGHTL